RSAGHCRPVLPLGQGQGLGGAAGRGTALATPRSREDGGAMRAGVDEAALRAVITYKWVKGAAELLLFLGLSLNLAFGWKDELAEWAHEFRDISARAYAVLLGRALEQATTPRGLPTTLADVPLDGIL